MGRRKDKDAGKGGAVKQKRPNVFVWRGLLAQSALSVRIMCAILLVAFDLALTFTQLGFAGIGTADDYLAYVVTLLQPIALIALLFGAFPGLLMGLFSGAALLFHASVMPLDYYEFTFVTPFTSVALLGACGFLLGVLFALALRNDPPQVRRVIYIAIVSFVVSAFFSLCFVTNVFSSLLTELSQQGAASLSQEQIKELVTYELAPIVMRLGDIGLQIVADTVLLALCCGIVDFMVRRIEATWTRPGLRKVFGAWLSAFVLLAFLVTAIASFVSITVLEQRRAYQNMIEDVDYVEIHVRDTINQLNGLVDYLNAIDMDLTDANADLVEKLSKATTTTDVFDGYTEEKNGTFIVIAKDEGIGSVDSGTAPDEASEAASGAASGTAPDEASATSSSAASEAAPDEASEAASDAASGTAPDAEAYDIADTPKEGYLILFSDSDRFAPGGYANDSLSDDAIEAIEESVKSGAVMRVVDDGIDFSKSDFHAQFDEGIKSHIDFLYARPVDDMIVVMMFPASKAFVDRDAVMLWTTLSFFVLLLVVFALTSQLLSKVVVRRVDEMNGVLSRITEGDLDARVDVRDTAELNSLSDGINETVVALNGWIAEAETRMDAELATAKAIQESALPRIFPPYPDIHRFDVYASMRAAKEVGGDFYDFFLIGDAGPDSGKLGFVIADVSGKGVPAALFMMKAVTQLRDYIESGIELGEAIENANRQLCDGNDADMFVTVWAGVLDYVSGHVDYVNAGHNPPLLWHGGSWDFLSERSGMPLGVFDGLPYTAYSRECTIGDQFLLYTDGVTEAMSTSGELYGEDRLLEVATEHFDAHPRELVQTVREDVTSHAAGAEQSDDITILALEVGVPPEVMATLVVPADVALLPRVNTFIHSELDRRLCPLRAQNQLDIAVEELFVNVARYAYPDATPDKPGMVRVSYSYSADPPSITVDIADDGIPYNPLEKPDAVTPDDIKDVPIGGLGILMAKRSVNEMGYERVDGSNIVTIVKKW